LLQLVLPAWIIWWLLVVEVVAVAALVAVALVDLELALLFQ